MALLSYFGTPFQGITAATVLALFALSFRSWLVNRPIMARAENERKIIDDADAARLRREFDDLNKQNRQDIHDLKDRLAGAIAAQHLSDKQLLEAASVQRQDRADMNSMVFLIRLLISEIKRLDPDPNNKIIEQAEVVLAHMGRGSDPTKSDALNTAEHAVSDAKQTVRSATAACEEVKTSEAKK